VIKVSRKIKNLQVISTNWIFSFVDDLLPASTVNLALRVFTALAQNKTSFYTRFKKDGGIRLLERILPSFCSHANIFHTLLCLLLGKSMGQAAAIPPQFEFLELFHYFKREDGSGAPHEIEAVEASYLLLAMAKRSYEESQMQAAAGLKLSSSTGDLPGVEGAEAGVAGLWGTEGQVYASFAAKLASAHPPHSSAARETASPAVAATSTVFSLVGSFINKVEQMGREGSREFGGEHNIMKEVEPNSPPGQRKKSMLSIFFIFSFFVLFFKFFYKN
jgi:hypothetical protein